MQFWIAFSSCVISDTAVVFVNGNHESGVLLWCSLILQTGSKLHPVWSTCACVGGMGVLKLSSV